MTSTQAAGDGEMGASGRSALFLASEKGLFECWTGGAVADIILIYENRRWPLSHNWQQPVQVKRYLRRLEASLTPLQAGHRGLLATEYG
jgi:hypothetical protein